jgi:hypothetical protein
MRLVIRPRIQRLEPLLGTAATDDGRELVLEGWMELIGAIAEVLGCSTDRPHRAWPYADLGSIAGGPPPQFTAPTTADPNSIARNAISRQDATVPNRETR